MWYYNKTTSGQEMIMCYQSYKDSYPVEHKDKAWFFLEDGELVYTKDPKKVSGPVMVRRIQEKPPSDDGDYFILAHDGEKYRKLKGEYTSMNAVQRLLPGLSLIYNDVMVMRKLPEPKELEEPKEHSFDSMNWNDDIPF